MKKMKLFSVLVAAMMAFSACGSEPASKADTEGNISGTFEAESQGNNGPVKVELTLENGKIASVEVKEHSETPGLSDAPIAQIPEAIAKNQSIKVDIVAGATNTSNAILKAAEDCLNQAGVDIELFTSKAETEDKITETRKEDTDILVIGGGGGGLAAAVKAAESGKKVTLVEKMPTLGGDTILNAGTLIATGSNFQKDKLKETNDSPELAYNDIIKIGKQANDTVLVKALTESIGSTVDWLVNDLEIPYDVAATQYPDHSAHRQIGVIGRSPAWVEAMSKKLTELGGTTLLSTKATELRVDEKGNVIGAMAEDAQGKIEFTAKSVILASGGYGAATKLLPDTLDGYKFYGLDSETGDGFVMATEIGADTINLDMVKVYPQGVETVPGRALAATASSTATTKGHGAIYVNSDGKRIVNETTTLGELTDITVAQKDKIMYIVMDNDAWQAYVAKSMEDKLVPNAETLEGWAKIVNDGKPCMATDADIKVAAEKMGINAENLAATIASYNENCKNGVDKDFGKENPVAVGNGPYYIVEQKPRFATTLGGLKANAELAILDKNGNAIPNLYGAGCVVGGANGKDSMTAMMNSWAIGSGVIAGQSAVNNIK